MQFVTKHSNIPRGRFLELMMQTGELASDIGSVVEGEDAAKIGLIDQLGGLDRALEYLHGEIKKNRTAKAGGV